MKASIFLFVCVLLVGVACDDDAIRVPQLTYEVITLGDATWNGEYNNDIGQRIIAQPFSLSSGWTQTFQPTTLPFEMFVFAESDCLCDGTRENSQDVIINFYVDNQLVKSDTNTWAKGVTSLLYMVE